MYYGQLHVLVPVNDKHTEVFSVSDSLFVNYKRDREEVVGLHFRDEDSSTVITSQELH